MKRKTVKFIKYFIQAIIVVGAVFYYINHKNKPVAVEKEVKSPEIENSQNSTTPKEENVTPQASNDEEIKQPEEENIPDKIFIKVPFTSQAPLSNWDQKHEEACEEASLIMIKYHLDKKSLNKNIAEKEIEDMIKFEIKKYGDYKDTDAAETVKLAEDYYKIDNLKVIYDFKPDDIKKYLAKGMPIIVPAAGRELGNPNFTAPGPLYHNLVLVGYDGDTIITNDPGTRKGEGYKYNLDTLYNAIHDFPGKPEKILTGKKAMIVIE
jgi:hypothetical protein